MPVAMCHVEVLGGRGTILYCHTGEVNLKSWTFVYDYIERAMLMLMHVITVPRFVPCGAVRNTYCNRGTAMKTVL